MALHSSYHDYMDYQVSNIFFDDLRNTPPQRLKFFFVPELDYDGYVHVVRDQEERKFKKDFRQKQIAVVRQEQLLKQRTRQNHREQFEASIKPSRRRKPGHSSPASLKPSQVKPARTQMQRWADQRKDKNDAKAVSMIEGRIQQEATEQQLFEGWRSAAQGSIRNKFRESSLINRQVEQQLLLPHTRRSQSSMGLTTGASSFGRTLQSQSTWSAPTSPQSEPVMSPAAVLAADAQVAMMSQEEEIRLKDSELENTAADSNLTTGQFSKDDQEIEDYLSDVHQFDCSINNRKVESTQRLRSLSLQATKTWTRPVKSSCQ